MVVESTQWSAVPLDELTEEETPITYGVVKPGEEGDVPFVRGGDIAGGRVLMSQLRTISSEVSQQYRRTLLRGGEILVSLVGNPGQIAIAPPELAGANIARQVGLVRLKPDIDTRFVSYFLQSHEGQAALGAQSLGSVQLVINLRDLKTVKVPLPPVAEQRSIAHILGTLDDKIELNRRMNETLEAMARAMFKSWFVDFDPVRAKMSGEPPESICQRLGLTPDLLALFPDRLVDSELGEIPEGWGVGKIDDHCHLNAKSWTTKTIPQEVHYVDLANAKEGIISEVQVFLFSEAPSRARRILHAGDTIVGTVRPGNRSFALIGEGSPALTGSTGFAVLSPKRKELRELVYFLATGEENIDRLRRLADGAAYPAVRPEIVTAGVCIIPCAELIDAFHEVVAPMIDSVISNRSNSDLISDLRDALLPKLLSGELNLNFTNEVQEVL